MDPHRLELLLELSRHGSMRAVAEETGVSTSTVSQQLAVLAREAGTTLVEPDGRRVRLTPAGKRLAAHAVTILAAIEAAHVDLDPTSEPAGAVRVAAFASAAREALLPVARVLRDRHPDVELLINEHEPFESLDLLAHDDVDLALTYDYNLAPVTFDRSLTATPLWETAWSLGVRAAESPALQTERSLSRPERLTSQDSRDSRDSRDAAAVLDRFRGHDWVVNSRNTADEDVVRVLASMAGFQPTIAHRVDSLDLVQDLIAAGLGIGLLPATRPTIDEVALAPLREPDVVLRAFAVTRRGRAAWPPLALVLRLVAEQATAVAQP
jgi:DNA-binding transcriptional LysR family regulator